MRWDELSEPWRVCLEEAWGAYAAGSMPIGAVVTDARGAVLSRGRSRISDPTGEPPALYNSPLAHAEMNALIALDYVANDPPHGCILYSTTEPCPMCLGTFYMSGLRELRYASREAFGGSVALLGATPYMGRKPIRLVGPEHPDLEAVLLALLCEERLRATGGADDVLIAAWGADSPRGVRLGRALYASGGPARLRVAGIPAAEAFGLLAAMLGEMPEDAG